jgi:hypothetical protein
MMEVETPLHMQVVAQTSKEALVNNMLPDFRDGRKKEFLALRSANYSITEALAAVGAVTQEYNTWKKNDPVFADWAVNHVWELQHNIGTEVLLARFKRCVFLQLSIDTDVLAKRASDPEKMTPDEKMDARAAANRYNAQAIATLMKALDPSVGQEAPAQAPVTFHLQVDVGLNDQEQYAQRKVQARSLLRTFKSDDKAIEGEYEVQQ